MKVPRSFPRQGEGLSGEGAKGKLWKIGSKYIFGL
jgi:hypothetical protein